MAKVHYSSDGLFSQTDCPYGKDCKVHSHKCVRNCRYHKGVNRRAHYVICLADCSSQLEAILVRIDTIIANNLFDEIVYEDFLADIREDIASILDDAEHLKK